MSNSVKTAMAGTRRARPITRIDRKAIVGLFWSVVAIAVALVAQGYLEGRTFLYDAVVLFAIVGIVFGRALRDADPTTPPIAPMALPGPGSGKAFSIGAAFIVAGLAVNSIGLGLFGSANGGTTAWAFYAGSLPLALAGAYFLDARPSLRAMLWRNRWAALAVGVLFLVALGARMFRLGEIPFGLWADEAFAGIEIQRILSEPSYRPVAGAGPVQGLPAMAWYLSAPLVALFGPGEPVLRFVPALFGSLGIVAIFLLGRALFGATYGLLSAAILATMAWHVTFSRIAMQGIYSTTLNTLALGLLMHALKSGRRTLFAAAGLALGLSLQFYFAARLFALVVALVWLHHLIAGRLSWLRAHYVNAVIFALFTWLAVSPLALLAYQNPRLFNERTENVTIFREIEQAGSYAPLIENVRKHLLMFNVHGDANGRHNLPGSPMLESTTAALAILGFIVALARARRPEYAAPLIWWAVMLLAGILSLAFEAPQGYRTIDNSVASALLAALPLALFVEKFRHLFGEARLRVPLVLAGRAMIVAPRYTAVIAGATVVLVCVAVWPENLERYFVRQARDSGVWAAHSTPETIIARQIASGAAIGKPYIDQTLMDHPSIRLIAPKSIPNTRFDPATSLPLRDGTGATIFVNAEASNQVATVLRLYPDAILRQHRNPAGGPIVLHEILVPPEVVSRLQGADVSLWASTVASGDPLRRTVTVGLGEFVDGEFPPSPYVLQWSSIVAAPEYGLYDFKLEGPATASLKIDGTELIRGGGQKGAILARGNHQLSIELPDGKNGEIRLLWRSPTDTGFQAIPREFLFRAPVSNNGLLGKYYRGTEWAGEPGLQQIDPGLQHRFHLLPLPRPYSVEWTGKLYIPADGAYRFGASSIDESWIYIDEKLIVDNSRNIGNYGEGGLVLTRGFHDIRVRYLDRTGHTYVNVFWTPPARGREPIPTEYLFPPLGSYPDRVVPPPVVRPAPAEPPQPAQPVTGVFSKPIASRPGPSTNVPVIAANTLVRIGAPGTASGLFDQPRGVAADREGNIYVADTVNHRIQKFGPDGKFLLAWGDETNLQEPLAISLDSEGNVVVLDSLPGWIKRYDPNGTILAQFGGPDARFYHPRGMALDAQDNVYVADTGGSRIVKYSPRGEQLGVIGSRGTGPGNIVEPTGASPDPFGNVWVSDSATSKLVRFGSGGSADVEIAIPKSGSLHGAKVAVSAQGTVLVTDPESGRIHVIGSDGTSRAVIASEDLKRPQGLAMIGNDRLVVGDVTLHHVVVLEIPGGV
ncbi:MAG: hypothetical protein FJ033_00275 [Chloroflexi bacterium]|nr:hypothetical protein [Chloroflexota bacterium]